MRVVDAGDELAKVQTIVDAARVAAADDPEQGPAVLSLLVGALVSSCFRSPNPGAALAIAVRALEHAQDALGIERVRGKGAAS